MYLRRCTSMVWLTIQNLVNSWTLVRTNSTLLCYFYSLCVTSSTLKCRQLAVVQLLLLLQRSKQSANVEATANVVMLVQERNAVRIALAIHATVAKLESPALEAATAASVATKRNVAGTTVDAANAAQRPSVTSQPNVKLMVLLALVINKAHSRRMFRIKCKPVLLNAITQIITFILISTLNKC